MYCIVDGEAYSVTCHIDRFSIILMSIKRVARFTLDSPFNRIACSSLLADPGGAKGAYPHIVKTKRKKKKKERTEKKRKKRNVKRIEIGEKERRERRGVP